MAPDDETLLAELAVLKGFCTQAQVGECRRLQSSGRTPAPLSDLLVFKGYLNASQLEVLRTPREKKTMTCPPCGRTFSVFTRSGGASACCPRCKGPLRPSEPGAAASVDVEITTQRLQVPRPATSDAATVSMVCVVCDVPIRWAPDESARVRCPSCGSTFTARSRRP